MLTKTFWMDDTDAGRRSLRRFTAMRIDGDGKANDVCPTYGDQHNAATYIDVVTLKIDSQGFYNASGNLGEFAGDRRWPVGCACGYQFKKDDEWQVDIERLYISQRGIFTLRDAPPGAMYDAYWMKNWAIGPDNRSLTVILPDRHPWTIDAEASNCDRKGDRRHHCWVRHGTPPEITVDKTGETCSAGAGSVNTGEWHGHLTRGYLHLSGETVP